MCMTILLSIVFKKSVTKEHNQFSLSILSNLTMKTATAVYFFQFNLCHTLLFFICMFAWNLAHPVVKFLQTSIRVFKFSSSPPFYLLYKFLFYRNDCDYYLDPHRINTWSQTSNTLELWEMKVNCKQ